MITQTYRVEVSSCAKCKHALPLAIGHRKHSWCALVGHGGALERYPRLLTLHTKRQTARYRRTWYERSDAGKCTRFVPTLWERIQQRLGLTKRELYETTLEPAKVQGACTVCKARPGEQCDARAHAAADRGEFQEWLEIQRWWERVCAGDS